MEISNFRIIVGAFCKCRHNSIVIPFLQDTESSLSLAIIFAKPINEIKNAFLVREVSCLMDGSFSLASPCSTLRIKTAEWNIFVITIMLKLCENESKTTPQQVTINHSHTMRCDTKSVIPSINYIFDTWVQHLLYYYDSNYVESSSSSGWGIDERHTRLRRCYCVWFISAKVKGIIYQKNLTHL